MRRVGIRIALVALALAAAVTTAAAVPLADYESRVSDAIATAESAYGPTIEDENASLDELRTLLPARETIELGDDAIDVDNTWIVAEVEAFKASTDETTRQQILDRITARLFDIEQHLGALGTAPLHATADERAKLQEILSRPEYQTPGESPFAKYLRDLRDRILKFFAELIESLFGGAKGEAFSTGLRIVIVAAGALAVILLGRALVLALLRRGRGAKRDKVKKTKRVKTVLGEEIDESTTADDVAAGARALAAQGDFRGAIRRLFVALIFGLDERGLVRLHAGATNREYLVLVREIGRLYPVMASMTDVFERVWYGEDETDRDEYQAFEAMYTRAVEVASESSVVHSP